MAIDLIRLFIVTARHLSITKAARELRTSQPTVSRGLTQLQMTLGIRLIKKNGRGIDLTNDGRAYFTEVTPILAQLDALQNKYAPGHESLRIAATFRPSKYILPEIMAKIGKRHPGASLTLLTRSSGEIEKLLLESKVDLAITSDPTLVQSSLVTEAYSREPLTPFVLANHPLAQRKSLRSGDVCTVAVIVKTNGNNQTRIEAQLSEWEKKDFKFKSVIRCESPQVVKAFVRLGTGVGILYYSAIERGIDRGEFKTLQKIPGFSLSGQNFIVYPKNKRLSQLTREFLSLLRASAANEPSIKTVIPQSLDGHRPRQTRDNFARSPLRY